MFPNKSAFILSREKPSMPLDFVNKKITGWKYLAMLKAMKVVGYEATALKRPDELYQSILNTEDTNLFKKIAIGHTDIKTSSQARAFLEFVCSTVDDARAVLPLIAFVKLAEADTLDYYSRELVCKATERLGDLGERSAVEPLIQILASARPVLEGNCGFHVVETLAKLKDPRAVEPLIKLLFNSDLGLESTAMRALCDIGDKRAVEPISKLLKAKYDPSISSKWNDQIPVLAAKSLKRLNGERSVGPLTQALTSPYSELVAAAIDALHAIGDKRAVGPLTEVLLGSDEELVAAAVDALETIGDKRAVGALTKLLGSPNTPLVLKVVETLGSIGDARAIGPLTDLLKTASSYERPSVVCALVELGDSNAWEPFLALLGGSDVGFDRAVDSLCRLQDSRAADLMIETFKRAKSPESKWKIAERTIQLKDRRGLKMMEIVAGGASDFDETFLAANALLELNYPAAIDVCEELLLRSPEDSDRLTGSLLEKSYLAESLAKMGEERTVATIVKVAGEAAAQIRILDLQFINDSFWEALKAFRADTLAAGLEHGFASSCPPELRMRLAVHLLEQGQEARIRKYLPSVYFSMVDLFSGVRFEGERTLRDAMDLNSELVSLTHRALSHECQFVGQYGEVAQQRDVMEAVNELCERKDVWSSCALYCVANRRDTYQTEHNPDWTGAVRTEPILRYDAERETAMAELECRGFQGADPAVTFENKSR